MTRAPKIASEDPRVDIEKTIGFLVTRFAPSASHTGLAVGVNISSHCLPPDMVTKKAQGLE